MMRQILIIAMMVVLVIGCQDEQIAEEKYSDDLIIKTGIVCGWCTINDTLSIKGKVVRYVNYTQCDNSRPAIENEEVILSSELEALVSLLDFNEFKKITLNTCNVCADGCDTWIFIKKGSETHQIRFTGNEPQLQPIKAFIDQLNSIKTNYQ